MTSIGITKRNYLSVAAYLPEKALHAFTFKVINLL